MNTQRAIEWLDANALRKENQYKAKEEEEEEVEEKLSSLVAIEIYILQTNREKVSGWQQRARIKNISHGIGWVSSDGIIRKVKKHIFMVIPN